MANNDTASMALFCDFENIALGVRDAQYEKFDIRPVLERLLAKGSIVVKKAYCDWDRYKGFKAAMHEANFELIEIPHVRQSGKNSADIRMVVDALDLCYTKSHVDTFVIISGDSDFSPLVSKLRENAKRVIGVGVKQSCSDLLITNCDEFIYYDDLVRDREGQRGGMRREREKRSPEEEARRREKSEERKNKAVELVATTFADMVADRGESERIWASVLKEVIKRRNPGFNESYYGFRTFGNLIEEAASRGILAVGRDEKSGTFVTRAQPRPPEAESVTDTVELTGALTMPAAVDAENPPSPEVPAAAVDPVADEKPGRRRGGRRGRKDSRDASEPAAPAEQSFEPTPPVVIDTVVESPAPEVEPEAEVAAAKPRRGGRRPRKTEGVAGEALAAPEAVPMPEVAAEAPAADAAASAAKPKKPRRTPSRSRKPKAEAAN